MISGLLPVNPTKVKNDHTHSDDICRHMFRKWLLYENKENLMIGYIIEYLNTSLLFDKLSKFFVLNEVYLLSKWRISRPPLEENFFICFERYIYWRWRCITYSYVKGILYVSFKKGVKELKRGRWMIAKPPY